MRTLKPGNSSYMHPKRGGVYVVHGTIASGHEAVGPMRPAHATFAEMYPDTSIPVHFVTFKTRIEALAGLIRARREAQPNA